MEPGWSLLSDEERRDAWQRFSSHFKFQATGGSPVPAIQDPKPSITFDLRRSWAGARPRLDALFVKSIETATARWMLQEFGDDSTVIVLDWQHDGYRLRLSEFTDSPIGIDGFPLIPGVYPDGDYYVFALDDLSEGTFGHPWEMSLCVFGTSLVRTLGVELASWLPVLRENH